MRDPDSLLGQNGWLTDYSHRDNIMENSTVPVPSSIDFKPISSYVPLRDQNLSTTTLFNSIVIILLWQKQPDWTIQRTIFYAPLARKADFLYSTVDTYVEEDKKDSRQHLVEIWNQMKTDKQNHLQMLREALEKEAKEENLNK